MAQQRTARLFSGQIASLTMEFNGDGQTLVELLGLPTKIRFPAVVHLQIGFHLAAFCVDDESGGLVCIDFVTRDWKRPISDAERNELCLRHGYSPIYESPSDIHCESVIKKLTDIEIGLVRYLTENPHLMREMHSDAFEKLIAELLASNGYLVEWTGRNSKTAADVIAFKADCGTGLLSNFIVECKRYSPSNPVGIEIARALYGAKVDENFASALLVTTSTFQEGVSKFAFRRWDFQLKDFNGLVEWLSGYRPRADGSLHMQVNSLDLKNLR